MNAPAPKYLQDSLYNLHMSVWNQGADAARKGASASDNPHPPLKHEFVSWHNGWAAATHHKAKEDDDL